MAVRLGRRRSWGYNLAVELRGVVGESNIGTESRHISQCPAGRTEIIPGISSGGNLT